MVRTRPEDSEFVVLEDIVSAHKWLMEPGQPSNVMISFPVRAAPRGGLFGGTGQGTKTTQDGDSAVWKCCFVGKPEAGMHKGVAIIEFMTASQNLSWMNNLIAIEELIPDPKTMELTGTAYEWK